MRRIIVLLVALVFIMAVGVVGCEGETENVANNSPASLPDFVEEGQHYFVGTTNRDEGTHWREITEVKEEKGWVIMDEKMWIRIEHVVRIDEPEEDELEDN